MRISIFLIMLITLFVFSAVQLIRCYRNTEQQDEKIKHKIMSLTAELEEKLQSITDLNTKIASKEAENLKLASEISEFQQRTKRRPIPLSAATSESEKSVEPRREKKSRQIKRLTSQLCMSEINVLKEELRETKDKLSKSTLFTDILLSELNKTIESTDTETPETDIETGGGDGPIQKQRNQTAKSEKHF